jgi:outer membrane receptor for ferrienterochelin and colicin
MTTPFRRTASLRGLLAAALSLVLSAPLVAQEPARQVAPTTRTGRIVGKVLDAGTGAPVVGAVVEVVGISGPPRSTSGINGRYSLDVVPAGPASIRVRMIGYTPKVVTGVPVEEGRVVEQDVSLTAQTVELEELTVTAAAERGSVARALDEQRTALGVTNAITTEQIAKSPDGDAAEAVQRVSGVSVQDGRYVVVRGLGERYTQTSLNGARIPSPEPERKVVPLDLFPAGLLEGVTTAKTFTPDLPGDFAGARVDIRTREFPTSNRFTLSFGGGYNSVSTGDPMLVAPREAGDLLALGAGERSIPAALPPFENFQTSAPTQAETNEIVNDFRNVWQPSRSTGAPASSFAASLGGSATPFGQPVGYLSSLSYGLGWDSKVGRRRAQAIPGSEPGSTMESDHFSGSSGTASVLWGGILNFSTFLGTGSRLAFNNTLNRSADSEARLESGFSEEFAGDFQLQQLAYVERSIRSNQLLGEHQVGDRHRFDWAVTSSGVTRDEPDRSEIVYALDTDSQGTPLPPAWFSASSAGAVRTFAKLDESSFEGAGNYGMIFGSPSRMHQLRFGGLYRSTDRDADNTAYSITAASMSTADRQLAPEQIFDGRFAEPGDALFRLVPLGAGGSYTAEDRLVAGYAMVDYALTDRLRLVGGARVERSDVIVRAEPTIGNAVVAEPSYTDILPSAALNYNLTENQVLRLAASQTLARPEYRELANVTYRDVLGGDAIVGNAGLERTLIQNLDVRWEWYLQPGEVISLGVFAKHFDQPIERVYLATSGSRLISFLNAESARNLGVELEVRRSLGWIAAPLAGFTAFGNVTLMDSDVTFGEGSGADIEDDRAMVGQSPYVVNLGLTWAGAGGGPSATVLYNVQGRRISSAGEAPLPSVYEEARHVVDVSLRLPLGHGVALKADAHNLLDAPYEYTQGSVVRDTWTVGRSIGVGISWGGGI